MKTSVCEYRMFRVVMVLVFVLSVVSVAGASEGVMVRGDEESPAASHEVSGVTVDIDGSALSGVLITLSGGGVNQKTVSDAEGAFHMTSVPPGSYSMVFKMKGKKKVKREVNVSTGDLDLGNITID